MRRPSRATADRDGAPARRPSPASQQNEVKDGRLPQGQHHGAKRELEQVGQQHRTTGARESIQGVSLQHGAEQVPDPLDPHPIGGQAQDAFQQAFAHQSAHLHGQTAGRPHPARTKRHEGQQQHGPGPEPAPFQVALQGCGPQQPPRAHHEREADQIRDQCGANHAAGTRLPEAFGKAAGSRVQRPAHGGPACSGGAAQDPLRLFLIAGCETRGRTETSKRFPGQAALLIVEPGVDLSRGQTIHAPVSAQHIGHASKPVAAQQDQEL